MYKTYEKYILWKLVGNNLPAYWCYQFIAIKMVLTVASLQTLERCGITMAMHIPQASTNVMFTELYIFPLNTNRTTLHFITNQITF
jgi:hypothetical protein